MTTSIESVFSFSRRVCIHVCLNCVACRYRMCSWSGLGKIHGAPALACRVMLSLCTVTVHKAPFCCIHPNKWDCNSYLSMLFHSSSYFAPAIARQSCNTCKQFYLASPPLLPVWTVELMSCICAKNVESTTTTAMAWPVDNFLVLDSLLLARSSSDIENCFNMYLNNNEQPFLCTCSSSLEHTCKYQVQHKQVASWCLQKGVLDQHQMKQ